MVEYGAVYLASSELPQFRLPEAHDPKPDPIFIEIGLGYLSHIKGNLKMIKIIAGTLILGLLFLQTPSAARKSDRELDGFIGPVKKSFIEWSPVSGYPYPPDSRCREHTSVYGPDGRKIQSSVYPGSCGGDEIRGLYTYDQEGNRITRTEEIRGENSPPPPPPPMPAPGAKKDEGVKGPPKTDFKYDAQGLLTERSTFRASGALIYKIIYTDDAKGRLQQTQTVYPEGKIGDKRVYSYEGEKHSLKATSISTRTINFNSK
jgi:hypothetical protein